MFCLLFMLLACTSNAYFVARACMHVFMVLFCLFALFHISHSSDFCQFAVQQHEGQSVLGVRELQGSPCACEFRTSEWEA